MKNDYIDVDYEECEQENDDSSNYNNVTLNTDPVSTLIHESISGFCGIVNNVTNAVKDYNICRQQEETKREEIRAYLKIGLAEINAKKELLLRQLDNQHELDIQYIKDVHEMVMKQLDTGIEAIRAAINIAKETNDFSNVIELMNVNNSFIETRSSFTLQLMERTGGRDSINMINTTSKPMRFIE